MTTTLAFIEPAPDESRDRDRRENAEDPDILATRPASQEPVPSPDWITSLEHWLDVCA